MDELRAWALIARVPALTARSLEEAIARAGGLDAVVAPSRDPKLLPPSAEQQLSAVSAATIDSDLRWIEHSGAALIPCTSPIYPRGLACDPCAPPVLYVLGDTNALRSPQIAMVGARTASAAGLDIAREFAAEFARRGLLVTSGLALGIDSASHLGALDAAGPTIAVCAHGLDRVYPEEHRALAARIRGQGALVSRFAPGARPRPHRFLLRNRMLSGMGHATLVVEAALKSGSLGTARHAAERGLPVFAIPGSIRNPLAAGCLALIRSGAQLALSPEDVLRALGISPENHNVTHAGRGHRVAARGAPRLDKGEEMLLDAVGFEPVSINTLVERTGLPSGSIASMLLTLELRGLLAPHPGGRYIRLS